MGDFAEGLKAFFTIGSHVSKVRLTKRMKEILSTIIEEDLSNTSILFDDYEESLYDRFMLSITWLKQELKIERPIKKLHLDKAIGYTLVHWIQDHRFHHLSGDPDFDNAQQWIINKINSKYSMAELTEFNMQ